MDVNTPIEQIMKLKADRLGDEFTTDGLLLLHRRMAALPGAPATDMSRYDDWEGCYNEAGFCQTCVEYDRMVADPDSGYAPYLILAEPGRRR